MYNDNAIRDVLLLVIAVGVAATAICLSHIGQGLRRIADVHAPMPVIEEVQPSVD